MHSGDRLEHEGPVCRCMDCARRRQLRREREGVVGVTRRQRFIGEIAAVEGDLGRTRGDFTDGGDLMKAATELEAEAERLLDIAARMGELSREALKQILDGQT